jgi:hypothetical protein
MPDAVYSDLVATLFTMTGHVIGLGVLYAVVGTLVYFSGSDAAILALIATGACLTVCRVLLIRSYHKSGGANQTVEILKSWERRYAVLTYAFAALIAILNLRVLSAHQPLGHLATQRWSARNTTCPAECADGLEATIFAFQITE